jgi:hypothetical protein
LARSKAVYERGVGARGVQFDFTASPMLSNFLRDKTSFVKAVEGPIGSGKSYGCAYDLFNNALDQEPYDGVRMTRFAIVRNTYGELKTTTLKTWTHLFPENIYGPLIWTPPITHHIRLPGSGDVPALDAEFIFMALDQPKDVRKLLSLELTGAWVNEGREVPGGVARVLTSRLRRYPLGKAADGREMRPTRPQMIMDTNSPDDDHWWVDVFEKNPIGGRYPWTLYRQPPAVLEVPASTPGAIFACGRHWVINPKAENLRNVKREYYEQQFGGKSLDWIRVYLEAKRGFVQEGRPVWPEYDDATMSVDELAFDKSIPLQIGGDFGLTPAAALGQFMPNGRWHIIEELPTFDMGLEKFGQQLLPLLSRLGVAPGDVKLWGDPAGVAREGIWETTAFQYLNSIGINAQPAPSNDFKVRRDAVALPMGRLIAGKPGLLVAKRCKHLRKGLMGGYFLQRVAAGAGSREIFKDAPSKGPLSHVCEALQYLLLGGGEFRRITRGPSSRAMQGAVASTDFDVLA